MGETRFQRLAGLPEPVAQARLQRGRDLPALLESASRTRKTPSSSPTRARPATRVIMNDSAFHMMMQGQPEGSEIYCQIPGKKHKMLCPSYRGQFYAKEMARVENCTRMSRPDYVFYDIECWHEAVSSAPECTRCRAAWKESGKTMPEFLFDCGTRQLADLKQAVAKGAAAAGIPLPVIGSYSREALRPKYGIETVRPDLPRLDRPGPAEPLRGRAGPGCPRPDPRQSSADEEQEDHSLAHGRDLWRVRIEQDGAHGARGACSTAPAASPTTASATSPIHRSTSSITRKHWPQLRPYEDLVVEGEVLDAEGSNPGLTYSALRRGGELLLLVGNYRNAEPRTSFPIPFTDRRRDQGSAVGRARAVRFQLCVRRSQGRHPAVLHQAMSAESNTFGEVRRSNGIRQPVMGQSVTSDAARACPLDTTTTRDDASARRIKAEEELQHGSAQRNGVRFKEGRCEILFMLHAGWWQPANIDRHAGSSPPVQAARRAAP